MERKTLIPLMVLIVLSLAAVAMAKGGQRYSDRPGQGPEISTENQAKLQAIFEKYNDKIHPLSEAQWSLKTELDALVRSGQADKQTITKLVKELSENREKIFNLHKQMSAEIKKETGLVFPMGGFGCGYQGSGPMGFSGSGYEINCPGGGCPGGVNR